MKPNYVAAGSPSSPPSNRHLSPPLPPFIIHLRSSPSSSPASHRHHHRRLDVVITLGAEQSVDGYQRSSFRTCFCFVYLRDNLLSSLEGIKILKLVKFELLELERLHLQNMLKK
ncbi:hypothetical protein Tco_0013854 [Tanacetum coccineum]